MNDVDALLLGAARALLPALPSTAVWTTQPEGFPAAVLFTTPDPAEDARRRTHRPEPAAYRRPEEVDLLLALPHGIPVPLDHLTTAQQRRARLMSPDAVDLDRAARTVTRAAVRPATVHLALVEGPATRRTIEQATAYAPFCTRAILAPHPPRDPALLLEAAYWGIGVAVETATGPQALVPPEPWARRRHSVAGWAFEESAYFAAALVPQED